MRTDLLDPKNDYVFKRLLADSPTLLASLINAVRYDRPPIEVVRVLNPMIMPHELDGKGIVLDVLAQDALGRRFNVEMQARKHPEWRQRGAFYLARTLAQQLGSGESYAQLRAAVGIHLLDFKLFDEPDQAIWRFELRDHWQPQQRYGDELELNVLEMRKAIALGRQPETIAAWLAFFEHWNEESTMERIDDAAVQEARRKLQAISADEEERIRAELREKAIRDEISWRAWALRTGREEGREQGLKEGRDEGRLEGRLEGRWEGIEEGRLEGLARGRLEGEALILQKQMVRRFGPLPEHVQSQLHAADAATLERWAERILEARTLDEFLSGS